MVVASNHFAKDAALSLVFDRFGGRRLSSMSELFKVYDQFYDNSVWSNTSVTAALTVGMTDLTPDFAVRGLWIAAKPIVDFYSAYTLQGMWGEEGTEGVEAWLQPAGNTRIVRPMLDVLEWSSLQTEQSTIARRAALYGVCLLVVVDEYDPETPAASKVRIEVRHPGELVKWRFDRFGNLKYALLETTEKEMDDRGDETSYTYGRLYTPTQYITYRDGNEYAFPTNPGIGNRRVSRWPNPHGFVPIRVVHHERGEGEFGSNAWYSIIEPLSEINLRTSQVGGNIGQHFSPAYFVRGMSPPRNDDGTVADVARSGIWYSTNPDADAKPLVASLQYEGVMDAYVGRLWAHIVDVQPELLITELARKSGELSGVAVQKMMTGLIKRADAAQDNYDTEIVKALQMALSMGKDIGGTGQDIWALRGYGDIGEYRAVDTAQNFEATTHRPPVFGLSELELLELEARKAGLKLAIENPPPAMPPPGRGGEDETEEMTGRRMVADADANGRGRTLARAAD